MWQQIGCIMLVVLNPSQKLLFDGWASFVLGEDLYIESGTPRVPNESRRRVGVRDPVH
jgi:hypothetical protein